MELSKDRGLGVIHGDASAGGWKSAKNIAELFVAQVAWSIKVEDAAVLVEMELEDEDLLGLGHAKVGGTAGSAADQLGSAQSGRTVGIAKLPHWLPLRVFDLNSKTNDHKL